MTRLAEDEVEEVLTSEPPPAFSPFPAEDTECLGGGVERGWGSSSNWSGRHRWDSSLRCSHIHLCVSKVQGAPPRPVRHVCAGL